MSIQGVDEDLDEWEAQADYASLDAPEDKKKKEYDTYERRADIYDEIKNLGSPTRLPGYRKLAERYGCKSKNSITMDMKELRKYILKNDFQSAKTQTMIGSAMERALEGALQNREWKDAVKIASEFQDWLNVTGREEDYSDPETQINNNIQQSQSQKVDADLQEVIDEGVDVARSEQVQVQEDGLDGS